MVALSGVFTPAHLKGMIIDPADPFKFGFLILRGDGQLSGEQKQAEYQSLVKYFLAALAVPDTDQWVNLSPYEKERIIPEVFGLTEMGRDLLAQDYLLKQVASSLTDPDSDSGKKFWARVYEEAYKRFGTTDIPADTFNKVWVVPDNALVYEKNNTVYVLESRLKVMIDDDYVAMSHNVSSAASEAIGEAPRTIRRSPTQELAQQALKEVIIPLIEKEVNTARNFAPLRQVYSGMLLATWYKRALKESILSRLYADQGKVKGIDQDPKSNLAIYNEYVTAFRRGVFNMIREDVDIYSNEIIPRKYFSGGFRSYDAAEIVRATDAVVAEKDYAQAQSRLDLAQVRLNQPGQALHSYAAMPRALAAQFDDVFTGDMELAELRRRIQEAKAEDTVWELSDDGNFIRAFSEQGPNIQRELLEFLFWDEADTSWDDFFARDLPGSTNEENFFQIVDDSSLLISLLPSPRITVPAGGTQVAIWARLDELAEDDPEGVFAELHQHIQDRGGDLLDALAVKGLASYAVKHVHRAMGRISDRGRRIVAEKVFAIIQDQLSQGHDLNDSLLEFSSVVLGILEPARTYDDEVTVARLTARQRAALSAMQIAVAGRTYQRAIALIQKDFSIGYDALVAGVGLSGEVPRGEEANRDGQRAWEAIRQTLSSRLLGEARQVSSAGVEILTSPQVVEAKTTILRFLSARRAVHQKYLQARKSGSLDEYEAAARIVLADGKEGDVQTARQRMQDLKPGVDKVYKRLLGPNMRVPEIIFLREGLLALSIVTPESELSAVWEVSQEEKYRAGLDQEEQRLRDALFDGSALQPVLNSYPYELLSKFQDEMVAYLTNAELRRYHVEDFIAFYRHSYEMDLRRLIEAYISDEQKREAVFDMIGAVWSDDNLAWKKVQAVIRQAKTRIDEMVDLAATIIYEGLSEAGTGTSLQQVEQEAYLQAADFVAGIVQFIPITDIHRETRLLRNEWRRALAGKDILSREAFLIGRTFDQPMGELVGGFARPSEGISVNGMGDLDRVDKHEERHTINAIVMQHTMQLLSGLGEYEESFYMRLADGIEAAVNSAGEFLEPEKAITDNAMKGGIDLAQSSLDMQIKRDGSGVPLPVSQQDLDSIRIDGLVPEIITIRPAAGLAIL
jgi:hypothetical protein